MKAYKTIGVSAVRGEDGGKKGWYVDGKFFPGNKGQAVDAYLTTWCERKDGRWVKA